MRSRVLRCAPRVGAGTVRAGRGAIWGALEEVGHEGRLAGLGAGAKARGASGLGMGCG